MADHRSCPRWQVNWQARLKLEGQEESACCTLRDINFKGAKVCSEQKLPQDALLKLSICLTEDCHIVVEAWVAWHKSLEGINLHGLYFTKIKDSDKEKIYQFIQSNFKGQIKKQMWEGLNKEEGRQNLMEDRRIFERFPVNFPLRFLDLKQNKEGRATARDVSAKGVGFVTNEALGPQTSLEIWIEIPDKGEPLYTRGEVAWSLPQGANEYRVGVDLEKADLMGLSRVLRAM